MNKIKDLIKEDKIEQAIKELLLNYNDEDSILLAAQYEKLAKDIRGGLLNPIDANLERNKLRKNILEKIDKSSEVKIVHPVQKNRTLLILSIFITLSILFSIMYFNDKNQRSHPFNENDSELGVQSEKENVPSEEVVSPLFTIDSIHEEKKEDAKNQIINNFTNNDGGVINIDQQ